MGFFCLFLPCPWADLHQTWWVLGGRLRAAPDISSRGSFLKVNVIEVKGQISVSQQYLVQFA